MKTKLWQRTVSSILAVTLGILNIESTGLFSNILPLSNMYTAAEEAPVPNAYITIKGDIRFDESTEDGKDIDWKSIVRPAVFDQKIKVKCTYLDENGKSHDVISQTQEVNNKENFYLKFENDGKGGGSFVIENVPEYVSENGETYHVNEYSLVVDEDSAHAWYYLLGNRSIEFENINGSQAFLTMVFKLNTQRLTIIPTVIPENSDHDVQFTFNNVFSSPEGIVTANGNKPLKYSASVGADRAIVIDVPIGVNYIVNQAEKDGYKLNENYTIIIGDNTESSTSFDEPLTIEKSDIIVKSSNFSQNLTKPFNVRWLDNNSLSRPQQTAAKYSEWFSINYKIEGSEWAELTEEALELLGLEKMPELKLTDTGAYYSGLSAVDPYGKPIQYEVVLKSINNETITPPGYRADVSEDGETFTFTEIIDYKATIKWNDDNDREGIRPESIVLELHRAIDNRDDIIDEITQSSSNGWDILVRDLPRYDENNYEYDYYIIQKKPIEITKENQKNLSYNKYYENGTGAYGNDITKCHNNGKITEVLSSETDFSAQKLWLDPDADKNKRPEATVTLWRYVNKGLTDENEDHRVDLDDAYIKGVVSQVMVIDSQTDQEKPLSYSLDKSKDDSTIVFSIRNSDGTSKEIVLPGNDDEGQEYVYFVRESLSGENADHYDIHYYDKDGKTEHKYGALDEGIIKNVQSERVAVNVKKVWKNPESLSDIDGASVQMIISAPLVKTGDYKKLIIYSEQENSHEILKGIEEIKAQTIEGFTADIPFSEVTYYADRYDENGNELDMSKAVFEEIVTDSSKQPIDTDHKADGSFKVAGTKYIPSTTFDGIVTLGDGTDRYSYTQINTAKPTRSYRLIKKWEGDINYSDIDDVIFQLERISVNDLANGSNNFEVVYVNGSEKIYVSKESDSTWNSIIDELDKYDDNGIQYYYRAKEIGFRIDGDFKPLKDVQDERHWSVLYHRDYDQTEAVNYISTTGGGFFTITKLWQDDTDISGRDNTIIKVYRKADLKTALEHKYGGSDPETLVSIDSLNLKPVELDLNNDNNYARYFSYNEGDHNYDFFVLEYSVGNDSLHPQPAQYTYGELKNALETNSSYSYNGTVENDMYQFDVKTVCGSDGDVMIINTRKGETSITVNKIWTDPDNADNSTSKTIQFQLYQNDAKYGIDISNLGDYDKDNFRITTGNDGLITIESTSKEKNWEFTISNLPMFSPDGVRLYYDIDEIPEEINDETQEESTSTLSYIQKKVAPILDSDNKTQQFTFNFENIITGTTTHVAYKHWKDADASITSANRPDIYFILYRYLKKDAKEAGIDVLTDVDDVSTLKSYEQYIDYKAQVWTTSSDAAKETFDYDKGYDLKVKIEDLPRFDEYGNEYGYVFVEQLNNDGQSVYGKYYGTADTYTADDGITYEVFTNTISDQMTISGTKVWTGFTGLRIDDVSQYPDPIIQLYRTTAANPDNALLVDEVHLNGSKKSYNFPNGTPDEEYKGNYLDVNGNYMLPKFDENGIRYKYFVKETFSSDITDLLYIKTNANGTLTNEFRDDINRCSIKVHKDWQRDVFDKEDEYPSVTFTLYRTDDKSVSYTELEPYDVRTITADQFEAAKGKCECTFENLLIYSPQGKEYTYYIVESSIESYSVTYYNVYGKDSSVNNGNIEITPKDRIDIQWKIENLNPNFDVGTKNTYMRNDPAKLSGTKIWNDQNNAEHLRPDDPYKIQLTLKRSTSSENGQHNAVENSDLGILKPQALAEGGPYVEWTVSTNAEGMQEWKYTIYNLERYAPNGLPYTYTLSEEKVDGYKKSADSVVKMENPKDSVLVNEFEKELEVWKVWHDGKNVYGLRPENVTLQLQRKTAGHDWENYLEPVTITEKNELENTGKNTWHYTFKNLPAINSAGEEYGYQCVETFLDGVPISDPRVPYTYKPTIKDDGTYVLANELSPTSLVVEKEWIGDEENLYSSRPKSVQFMLQKQVVDENGDVVFKDNDNDGWIDVMKFTLEPDKLTGKWKTTLYDLPIAQILKDKNNNQYKVYSLYFRAVELDKTGKDGPLPNYTKTEIHTYNEESGQNESVIKNTLVHKDMSTISVNKVWYKNDPNELSAEFELLYKVNKKISDADSDTEDESENEWKSFTTPVKEIISGNGSFTWENLPKFDRDGNELEYKVVEKSIDGYMIEEVYDESKQEYTFTNIELQDYTVKKIWQNTDYAHKAQAGFTAKFQLESKVDNGGWTKVAGSEVTLTSVSANDNQQTHTWKDLPMYDDNGYQITYRAVEVYINDKAVANDTNGDYIVTYQYDNQNEPSFTGNETVATNRMIYGFVNLSKMSAYFSDSVESGGKKLKDVVFDIYACDSEGNPYEEPYVSDVKTDSNGNLIYTVEKDANEHNIYKYGDGEDAKALISGTYLLKEKASTADSNPDFSILEEGVRFTVGNTGNKDTGEHGTAWIKTVNSNDGKGIKLDVDYIASSGSHYYGDSCKPKENSILPVFNIESRGVIRFTKTEPGTNGKNDAIDTHSGSQDETPAYFAVYANGVQVAGLSPSTANKADFILTNLYKDGNEIEKYNAAGIPYLRQTGGIWTLLSGKYTIEEIVPPAGYKLDPTPRTAVIKKLVTIKEGDTVSLYGNNIAEIEGDTVYEWNNNPNTVKINKKDQYGRDVVLGEGKYLVLKIDDEGSKFPTGESEIYLYQNKDIPATDPEGNLIENYISYDEEGKNWVITKLFDSSKTYTLSEPMPNVPENYVIAKDIKFTVNKTGELVAVSGINPVPDKNTEPCFENVYKSDASDNIIVMRDVSRYLKNVALEKKDSETNEPIENISFMLYKNGENVIEGNKLLTTNSEGKIDLSQLDDSVINKETGYPLKYGLDIGEYYFEEREKGASDGYQISNKIYFEIKPKTEVPSNADYEDYAEVVFDTTNTKVSQSADSHTGVVENDPVMAKHIELTKTDSKNSTIKISGAEFTLEYLSITDKQTGSSTNGTAIKVECITDENGILRLKDDSAKYPDISMKGHYVLTETKAPENYMTPTHKITKIEFDVETDNTINENINSEGAWTITSGISDDGQTLNLNVKNEKTVVNISKLNDIVNGTKNKNQKTDLNGEAISNAVLKIYEESITNSVATLSENGQCEPDGMVTKSDNLWTLTGVLKENTIYRLHEDEEHIPVGYMQADDIYFKIYGTNSQMQSVVYVWSGKGEPVLNSTNWKTDVNLKNNVLTMVDEAIIAPVDMQKVVGENGSYAILKDARFDVKVGETLIGTAVSNDNGWLVWESIDKLGSVFDSNGTRVTDKSTVIGKTIILQQNESGYTFTETYAPSHAYNNGDSCTVNITSAHYLNYKDNSNGYNNNCYIDIQNGNWVTSRVETASADDFVNPPYWSIVTLHKYDNDEEAQKKLSPIADTEFTLYKADGTTPYTKASMDGKVSENGVFKTASNGNLNIVIYDKGTYVLKETNASTGYQLDENNVFTFTLQDKANESDNENGLFGYKQTNELKKDGVPNERKKGKVVFTKKDDKTGEYLNDVEFTFTRNDTPANPENYLLKDSVTVKTGHSYRAEKSDEGNWEINEIEGAGSAGVIKIEGLNWGNYTLTESKELSGYILGSNPLTYTFDVNAANADDADNHPISNTETNTKNKVTLYKTNQIDPEIGVVSESDIKGLAGAEFEIHEVTESGETGDKVKFYLNENDTKPTDKVISGAYGKVTVYGLPTNNTGDGLKTYHLVETKAPKGYKLQTTPTVFTIDRDGNVTSVGNTEVTMEDEAIKIYLKKTDTDGNGLDGSIFKLTDVCENCDNNHHLADGTDYFDFTVNSQDGNSTMIDIEKVIGGHKYKLEETKAPDGYECTAEMTFFVETDGTISNLEKAGQGKWFKISLSEDKKTITVADEIISSVLTKVDYDNNKMILKDVVFILKPYGENSKFSNGFTNDSRYNKETGEFTFTTDAEGQFAIPDGLVKHDNKYLLCEKETIDGYYLSKEAKEGVILNVHKDGGFSIERLPAYADLNPKSCPISCDVDENGVARLLIAYNKKAASFELTKNVEGNMGDLNGEFNIEITAYEVYKADDSDKTDEIKIDSKEIVLGLNDKYDSEKGDKNGKNAFGTLPVGAKIEIRENNDLDYQAVVVLKDNERIEAVDGVVTVILDDASTQLEIKLINLKEVPIDMGVDIDADTVIPIAAFMMLSAWLYLRSRRKRDLI